MSVTSVMLLTLGLLSPAGAAAGSASLSQPEAEERSQLSPEQRAAIGRQIARIGIIDYRSQSEPSPADAEISAAVLSFASGFRPDDPILLRYLIAAERAAGDEQAVIDATASLVRLDPEDEVAQLRLISWSISRKQTTDERLAAYAEWLDGRGRDFLADSPAIASRLALDAALLHREDGDDEAFIGRLAQATRLDSSNKEAAALAAAVFGQRSQDPVARLELAINLLLADPVDPALHLAVAEQLAERRAFDQARRFFNLAAALYRLAGTDTETPQFIEARTSLDWHTDGPEAVLANFERQLRSQRAAAKRRIDQLIELGQPVQDELRPEDIRLDLERERFRLYAALALGDRIVAERSIEDLDASTTPVLDRIGDLLASTDQSDTQSRNALVQQGIQLGVSTIVARLVADVESRVAADSLARLIGTWGDALGDQTAVLEAAARFRLNGADASLDELADFADRTALGALFYGLALEELGRNDEAIEQFQRAADVAPLKAIGVLADAKAAGLRGRPAAEPQRTGEMRSVAEAVPNWIDTLAAGPRSFMRLSAGVEQDFLPATAEAVVTLEFRNTLPRPLGMGGDRPIGTRLALIPRIDIASHQLRGAVDPEVVDAHRKLRLAPGEAVSVRVWPDAGAAGLIQDIKAGHRVRSRFNALQNFQVGQGVPYQRGPLSLASETPLITRVPLTQATLPAQDLVAYARTADEPALVEFLPAFRAALADVDYPQGQLSAADAAELAGVIAARYPGLSLDTRAAIVAIMPPARMRQELAPLDRVVLQETDPLLAGVALVSRVTSASDPSIAEATNSEDPALAGLARALAARLRLGDPDGFAFLPAPPSFFPADDEADTGRDR
ncbi:MAG: hypothetical protein AAFR96_04405 [Planctomycetota bacterium]